MKIIPYKKLEYLVKDEIQLHYNKEQSYEKLVEKLEGFGLIINVGRDYQNYVHNQYIHYYFYVVDQNGNLIYSEI